MNRREAARAVEELESSPARGWIGNKVVDGAWLQRCMRCGAEDTLVLPPDVHDPEDVPVGFDERLFAWKRAFQVAHERCVEASAAGVSPAEPGARPPTQGVTMKRLLYCERHGARWWQGHVMCEACGRTYQVADERKPGYAPETCRCGRRLLPPAAERVGDVLGLRTGGVVVDERGRGNETPVAEDWTARSICYLCYRYFAKHCGGRVPVEAGRN